MKTKKINVKQLREMIERVAAEVIAEQKTSKKLREKMELGRMGATHGAPMSFDQWEAGAHLPDPDVAEHMKAKHGNEKRSEMKWAQLYNTYEEFMGGGSHPVMGTGRKPSAV